MRRLVAAGALALCLAPSAVAADTRPSKPQAGAAVNEYKAVRERCAADDAACEGRARQRFVEVVSCVAHGAPKVNPATLQQDFARYVDLVSEVLDGPDAAAPASPGPCFGAAAGGGAPAGAAPGTAAPAARQGAPAQPADEGPSVESLRRFRKQAEEQSRPVTALPDTPDASGHANLKAQLEEMRARLRSGDASSGGGGGTIGGGGFVPGVAAPAPVVPGAPLAAPAPTGTTNISGGPSAPPAAVIGAPTGGPTPPPASGGTISGPAGGPTSGYVIQRPPGALDPAQLRRQLAPGTVILGPPAPVSCSKGMVLCGNRCVAVGTACP